MNNPEPISKYIVCSECGMNWEEHGDKPTLEDCVRLLKEALAKPVLRSQSQYLPGLGSRADVTSFSGVPLDQSIRLGKIQ